MAGELVKERKPRTRSKAEYLIEKQKSDGWQRIEGSFKDTGAAVAHIRESEMVGEFRVIAVTKRIKTEQVTTTAIKFV